MSARSHHSVVCSSFRTYPSARISPSGSSIKNQQAFCTNFPNGTIHVLGVPFPVSINAVVDDFVDDFVDDDDDDDEPWWNWMGELYRDTPSTALSFS